VAATSPFDYLAALAGADAEIVAIIGADFLEIAPADLKQMQAAAAAGDADTLGRLAHTYKGLAGNFRAQALADAAASLQTACRNGYCEPRLLSAVEVELNALCEALRSYLKSEQA
jgi:HPt (histidine-containing phosphotransfer) domain-containing protein